jgi:hypothetical protein
MRRLQFTVLICLVVFVSAVATLPAQNATRRFTLDDFSKVARVSDPQFAPDGKSIAVVVSRPNLEDNRYDPEANAGAAGAQKLQVFVVSSKAGGTAPKQLSTNPRGVQQLAWSPDSKTVAFAAQDEPEKKPGFERFNRSFEMQLNSDYTWTEAPPPTHLWMVAAAGGDPKRLTSGTWTMPISRPPGSPIVRIIGLSQVNGTPVLRPCLPIAGDLRLRVGRDPDQDVLELKRRHVGEPAALDQRVQQGGALGARQAAGEEPILPAQRDHAELILGAVVVDRHAAILDEPLQRVPLIREIAQGIAQRRIAARRPQPRRAARDRSRRGSAGTARADGRVGRRARAPPPRPRRDRADGCARGRARRVRRTRRKHPPGACHETPPATSPARGPCASASRRARPGARAGRDMSRYGR